MVKLEHPVRTHQTIGNFFLLGNNNSYYKYVYHGRHAVVIEKASKFDKKCSVALKRLVLTKSDNISTIECAFKFYTSLIHT